MSLIENIIESMLALINLHGLELMRHYPDDLVVHDRRVLDRAAHPGAKIAWVVGNTHTHMALLGVHAIENQLVAGLTNLSSSDRFYILKIEAAGFGLKEMTREAFGKLSTMAIPYKRVGTADAFWLYRHDTKIGYCRITRSGDFQSHKYTAELTPMEGIGGLEKAALHTWASHAVTELGHSLFVRSEFAWMEPLRQAA